MKQKYFFYILLFFLNLNAFAQDKKGLAPKIDTIEGLQVYPNPVTNGRLYISTDQNLSSKEIDIYDMLGKKVFSVTLVNTNKEINVTNLNSGVYLIKIKENNYSVTRKLIIK